MFVDDYSNTAPLCWCPMSVCLCASLCISVSLHIFPHLFAIVCVSALSFTCLLYVCLLDPCLPSSLGFIPVSLSDGRSSSQAFKEEDLPALNPPQLRKGRFQVRQTPVAQPCRGLSKVDDVIAYRLVPPGHSSATVLSPKTFGVGSEQHSQKNRALLRHPGGTQERRAPDQ